MVKKLLMVLAAGILSSLAVGAGTIGPDCGSCFGGIYTLDGVRQSGDALTETWRFTYTLETQGVTGTGISYVSSIAAKVSSHMLNVYAVDNPTTGGWTDLKLGGLNNSGCNGNGAGWACIAWKAGDRLLTGSGSNVAASYTWVFDVKMETGSLLGDPSIKANFDSANGKLMSEKITVPEGSSPELPIVLSGLGLWMLGRNRWKRRMAA